MDCSGTWESDPAIDIQGADLEDAGKDLDVHVHLSSDGRTYAVSDDPTEILLFYGLAGVGATVAIGSVLRIRRRATRP